MTLRNVIDEVLKAGDYVSPYDAVPFVMAEIPEGSEREYLTEAIRLVIPSVAANMKRANLAKAVQRTKPEPVKGGYTQILLDEEGEEVRTTTPGFSYKRQLIVDAWQDFLSSSMVTESGNYIKIAMATVADLRYAASIRRSQAAANVAEAEKYEALARRMDEMAATSLGELTSDDVRGIV